MEEEDFLIDLDTALSVAHFRNSSRTTSGRTFSCAVDCFLEICYRLLLPEVKDKMLFEESSEFFSLLQISGSMEIIITLKAMLFDCWMKLENRYGQGSSKIVVPLGKEMVKQSSKRFLEVMFSRNYQKERDMYLKRAL